MKKTRRKILTITVISFIFSVYFITFLRDYLIIKMNILLERLPGTFIAVLLAIVLTIIGIKLFCPNVHLKRIDKAVKFSSKKKKQKIFKIQSKKLQKNSIVRFNRIYPLKKIKMLEERILLQDQEIKRLMFLLDEQQEKD